MKYGFVRNAVALVNVMLTISLVLGLFGSALAAESESGCHTCGHASASEPEHTQKLNQGNTYTAIGATPTNVKVELGFALDGSGSINPSDWTTQLTGLANVIKGNDFRKDGTIELTVVQFGVNNNCTNNSYGAEVEITPTIITASNYQQIANSITQITQGGMGTPLSCGLNLLADAMYNSSNFDPNLNQVINIITDGDPTDCCANSSYCANLTSICDAKNDSVAARNYLINKLQLTPSMDKITCEFIGNNINLRDWMKNEIVWPQPGAIAPPYPPNNGWVRMIASYRDLEEAIKEKIKTLIPPTPPSNKTSDINYDSLTVGNDNAQAVKMNGFFPFSNDPAKAVNNLEIKKNQQVGPCECCQALNESRPCQDCCTTLNIELVRVGNRNARAFGSASAINNNKIVTSQGS